MGYAPYIYAKAFLAARNSAKKGQENVLVANLISVAEKHGDKRLLKKIAEQSEVLATRKEGGKVVTFESARPLSGHMKKQLHGHFGKKDIVHEEVRPELIAGIRIVVNGEKEFDRSFKGLASRILG